MFEMMLLRKMQFPPCSSLPSLPINLIRSPDACTKKCNCYNVKCLCRYYKKERERYLPILAPDGFLCWMLLGERRKNFRRGGSRIG